MSIQILQTTTLATAIIALAYAIIITVTAIVATAVDLCKQTIVAHNATTKTLAMAVVMRKLFITIIATNAIIDCKYKNKNEESSFHCFLFVLLQIFYNLICKLRIYNSVESAVSIKINFCHYSFKITYNNKILTIA